MTPPHGSLRTAVYTTVAMVAFAGNSVICRMALFDGSIDPASFTSVRLVAGVLTLLVVLAVRSGRTSAVAHGSWRGAITLIVYAIFFSYAYVSLSAASGALILFGFVQATMIVAALRDGERPHAAEWLGWIIAAAGLVWLLLPGATAPPPLGAALMAVAGVGWGLYSLYGRSEPRPLAGTTGNFVRVMAPVLVLVVVTFPMADLSTRGVVLAIVSGSLTTGLGYVIWYAALKALSAMQAALVQLSVPAIAALGGAVLVAEPLTPRLLLSGALILGGISVALGSKYRRAAPMR